jgi:hypothetical protein
MSIYTDVGVIIGWPIKVPGDGRMPKEFVVLARFFPGWQIGLNYSVSKTIREYEKTERYRKILFVPFELEEEEEEEETTDGKG